MCRAGCKSKSTISKARKLQGTRLRALQHDFSKALDTGIGARLSAVAWSCCTFSKGFPLRGVPKGRVTVAQHGFGAAEISAEGLHFSAEPVLGRGENESKSLQGRLTVGILRQEIESRNDRDLCAAREYRRRARSQSSLKRLWPSCELTQHRFSTIELRDSTAHSGAEPVLGYYHTSRVCGTPFNGQQFQPCRKSRAERVGRTHASL